MSAISDWLADPELMEQDDEWVYSETANHVIESLGSNRYSELYPIIRRYLRLVYQVKKIPLSAAAAFLQKSSNDVFQAVVRNEKAQVALGLQLDPSLIMEPVSDGIARCFLTSEGFKSQCMQCTTPNALLVQNIASIIGDMYFEMFTQGVEHRRDVERERGMNPDRIEMLEVLPEVKARGPVVYNFVVHVPCDQEESDQEQE